MAQPHATIAILSIGQMGLGIAALLQSNNYTITTTLNGRSPATRDRAASLGIRVLDTDEELVATADYLLSIVPPRDAVATAERVIAALQKGCRAAPSEPRKHCLYYLDLNAVSTSTARGTASLFENNGMQDQVRYIDGCIIGTPPRAPSSPSSSPQSSSSTTTTTTNTTDATSLSSWYRPGIPLSGPAVLPDAHLASVLNTRHLGPQVGTASGLKCCFAALTKGFTGLALQAFTTAESLGVLPDLLSYMDVYNPGARAKAERGVVACTGKAYRWVEEMRQIGECFDDEGGWTSASVFRELAAVFQRLADVVEHEGGSEGMSDVRGVVGALGGM
ncbi:hypothetical protein ACJQWK_10750 [Exserohilum turcicum]|uniref:6-phosphogluconate dehydrogenase C-terminal domain-like protein n=1 Tax=Exserohilum turcicum (strain 28A) TaxID=671987 RepID=R0I6T3_EXST2|nr:uncharacterized protein SETTUDRAFT_23682 [Exserohilum turcica Et28A]EOA81300.1 hypothetical protein SETTUDRAFT_23682 [Exserohilum turcica Et28A]